MSLLDIVEESNDETIHRTECTRCGEPCYFNRKDAAVRYGGFDSSLRIQERSVLILKCNMCNKTFETY